MRWRLKADRLDTLRMAGKLAVIDGLRRQWTGRSFGGQSRCNTISADPNLDPSAWDLNGFDEQLRSVHTARMWNHKFVYDWPMRNCFMAPSSGIYKSTIPGRPDDAALNLSLLIAKCMRRSVVELLGNGNGYEPGEKMWLILNELNVLKDLLFEDNGYDNLNERKQIRANLEEKVNYEYERMDTTQKE
ncbi:hypothetical protein T01_12921 [Trichinella spiralis]|uniref:Uncharacterized protein n=1 Tax=Trichinella spiralis TaxID=6334 RepID=A0A0V1BR32_TRISP|nr:hypothetical protein T01_12921 [Trichinella spiralis]